MTRSTKEHFTWPHKNINNSKIYYMNFQLLENVCFLDSDIIHSTKKQQHRQDLKNMGEGRGATPLKHTDFAQYNKAALGAM